ncbi:MAG: hypothetical protein ABI833_20920 [Acidobacteriota bacterium]
MKVLVNGGLNLSVLDGWWAEAYSPDVGWAIGDERKHGEDPVWETADAEALYNTLEQEVIPQFYERDPNGIPLRWVARIRESMARLTPAFSANRSVRQYTEEYYLRLGATYRARSASGGEFVAGLLEWQAKIAALWSRLHFGPLHAETRGDRHLFEIPVYLGELDPGDVRIDLYANASNGRSVVQQEMTRGNALLGPAAAYLYSADVLADRPVDDYTPRVVPSREGAFVPLESTEILWQR